MRTKHNPKQLKYLRPVYMEEISKLADETAECAQRAEHVAELAHVTAQEKVNELMTAARQAREAARTARKAANGTNGLNSFPKNTSSPKDVYIKHEAVKLLRKEAVEELRNAESFLNVIIGKKRDRREYEEKEHINIDGQTTGESQ